MRETPSSRRQGKGCGCDSLAAGPFAGASRGSPVLGHRCVSGAMAANLGMYESRTWVTLLFQDMGYSFRVA